MVRTRGEEKRKSGKIAPRKKMAAESLSQLSLRDKTTGDLAMQEEELDMEINPAPGRKITAHQPRWPLQPTC